MASLEPEEGSGRDCWSVAFGGAHTDEERCVAAGEPPFLSSSFAEVALQGADESVRFLTLSLSLRVVLQGSIMETSSYLT